MSDGAVGHARQLCACASAVRVTAWTSLVAHAQRSAANTMSRIDAAVLNCNKLHIYKLHFLNYIKLYKLLVT